MSRKARVAALLACVALLGPTGCGGGPPPRPATAALAEPHWQDVFETLPELLVVVRAKAARQDRVFGPLLRRALDLAREHSKAVTSTRALEAMSDADELVMALRPDTADGPGETVLVARGVRADIDPGALTDDDGRTLWTAGPASGVRELVRERDEQGHPVGASLFELPGRTWVIAQGDARTRAREVFAHPFNRPALDLEPQALAIVRIDGPSLVARVRALQDLGRLSGLGRHLRSVTFVLPPGADRSVRMTLAYVDDDSAALAEVVLKELVGAVSRSSKAGWLAWLGGAQVQHVAKAVVASGPLPPRLVDALLQAGSAPLELPSPDGGARDTPP